MKKTTSNKFDSFKTYMQVAALYKEGRKVKARNILKKLIPCDLADLVADGAMFVQTFSKNMEKDHLQWKEEFLPILADAKEIVDSVMLMTRCVRKASLNPYTKENLLFVMSEFNQKPNIPQIESFVCGDNYSKEIAEFLISHLSENSFSSEVQSFISTLINRWMNTSGIRYGASTGDLLDLSVLLVKKVSEVRPYALNKNVFNYILQYMPDRTKRSDIFSYFFAQGIVMPTISEADKAKLVSLGFEETNYCGPIKAPLMFERSSDGVRLYAVVVYGGINYYRQEYDNHTEDESTPSLVGELTCESINAVYAHLETVFPNEFENIKRTEIKNQMNKSFDPS